MLTLRDKRNLLLRAKDTNGNRILSIKDYYEDKISPKASKYSRYSFSRSNTVVCPFHIDNDPSFGVLLDRSGKERYNCFGCGVTGDYIDFYIAMERSFFGRALSEEVAVKELIEKYNIDVGTLTKKEESQTSKSKYESVLTGYHEADYLRDIRKGMITSKPLGYYNAKLLQIIGEQYKPNLEGGN